MAFTIRAHFDGKVFVPDEPVDLQPQQAVVVHLEGTDHSHRPRGTPFSEIQDLVGTLPREDAEEMTRIINDEFGHVEDADER
jgi:hypothetical protein